MRGDPWAWAVSVQKCCAFPQCSPDTGSDFRGTEGLVGSGGSLSLLRPVLVGAESAPGSSPILLPQLLSRLPFRPGQGLLF